MNNKTLLSRRNFLQIIAAGSVAGLALKFGMDKLTEDEVISETRLLMGTVVNIKALHSEPGRAREAIRMCFDRMEDLEAVLSRFLPESQLSVLNRVGRLKDPHPALVELVQQSREISELSEGAFDITIKPLLDLYQAEPGILLEAQQIEAALPLVDYRRLEFDNNMIALQKPGMSITLDGIAKGFIVDEGVAVLKQFGFTNVMVEAGGDLMGIGEKAPHSPWRIGLQAPRAEMGDRIASFKIQDQAIATSGDYMQAFTSDFTNHHIIDPRTGHSSPDLASVSVIAPTATLADGLATAAMVLGRSALEVLKPLSNCKLFAVTKSLEILQL